MRLATVFAVCVVAGSLACRGADATTPGISPDQLSGRYSIALAEDEAAAWVRAYMYCMDMEVTLPGTVATCPTGVLRNNAAISRGAGDTLIVAGIPNETGTPMPRYRIFGWRGDANRGTARYRCDGSTFCNFQATGSVSYQRR